MQYFLPNDHFSCVGCIRCFATEQCLKLNSDKSFLLKTLLYSAVIESYTTNTQELHLIAMISSIPYFRASYSFGGNRVET